MNGKLMTIVAAISIGLFNLSVSAAEDVKPERTQAQIDPGTQNKLLGQAYLAKNMSKPGVVTLPDGLQYRVIKVGQGPRPSATDTVTVHYAGRLINGQEFDSSYKRGEPTSFPVSGVIPGWTEALQRMNKGAVWELTIPAALAYGEQGAPPTIGPNETLIFKVELLDIKSK
jgi:FKBP-type peptidyl-prolyl cis-trans isomerase FklB